MSSSAATSVSSSIPSPSLETLSARALRALCEAAGLEQDGTNEAMEGRLALVLVIPTTGSPAQSVYQLLASLSFDAVVTLLQNAKNAAAAKAALAAPPPSLETLSARALRALCKAAGFEQNESNDAMERRLALVLAVPTTGSPAQSVDQLLAAQRTVGEIVTLL